jgi:hypothetical protein
MKIFTETDTYKGGWFVGNFEETAYKTEACEVAYKLHTKGEQWDTHYHKLSDEINYLIEGIMKINDQVLTAPCVFVIEKEEVASPIFLTDVRLIVVKIPGILNDKYSVEQG